MRGPRREEHWVAQKSHGTYLSLSCARRHGDRSINVGYAVGANVGSERDEIAAYADRLGLRGARHSGRKREPRRGMADPPQYPVRVNPVWLAVLKILFHDDSDRKSVV